MKKLICIIFLSLLALPDGRALAQTLEPDTTLYDPEDVATTAILPDTVAATDTEEHQLVETHRIDDTLRRNLTELIMESHTDWETVCLNGKLRMEGLPVTPSVRIYMSRDREVMISLRAPLLGEVGRIEAGPDSITVIDKMHRNYYGVSLRDTGVPVGLGELQSLLLRRVWLPGFGLFDDTMSGITRMVEAGDGSVLLLPDGEAVPEGYNYGYILNPESGVMALIVTIDNTESDTVTARYVTEGESTDIYFDIEVGDTRRQATLELDAPVWGCEPMQSAGITSKYKKVSLKDFLKAF